MVVETCAAGLTGRVRKLDEFQHGDRPANSHLLESHEPPNQIRGVVADSWVRSSAAGVDPDHQLAPVVLDGAQLIGYRDAHPLSQVFPLLYDVLGRSAVDCDCVMAVGDADGKLLWVCGPSGVLRRAESIHFVAGAAWDEANAGTNAPGTALHLDAPVQIRRAEHFNRLVHGWSCAAAPIHDPITSEILGVVDITGGEDVASPQTMGMVRAAARMAESELARLAVEARMTGPASIWVPGGLANRQLLRIRALGLPDCMVELDGRTYRLSPRHSEILVVLIDHPDGLSAEQLAIEVYAGEVQSSTMRAEMTRLRALLGPAILQSRPYRLVVDTECDWKTVGAQLAAGRINDAVHSFRGPLLPNSDSPGVRDRREVLERQLRAAILSSARVDLMVSWTRSRWGADDLQMWQRQAELLPSSSPLRPMAAAEAARLERSLGVG
jgi:hypothetical protein